MAIKFTVHPLGDTQRTPKGASPDAALIRRLTDSFAICKAEGVVLTERFYGRLFERYPNLRAMFPTDMSQLQKKLLDTLAWVVANLENPTQVQSTLAELGARHQQYGAAAQHFPIIRDELLAAMAEVSGEHWSATLEADWRTAIDLISRQMLRAYRPS